MADKPDSLILEALSRAMADPSGAPLHGTKASPGLFGTTQASREAAQRCKDEGYLHVVRKEASGKTPRELCSLTEKGLAYLLSQLSPRQAIERFIESLDARHQQIGELVATACRTEQLFSDLKATAEKVLAELKQSPQPNLPRNGSETWKIAIRTFLTRWEAERPIEDCPLPELYRRAQQDSPALTIGRFHDGLRELVEGQELYLHPWSGPLYDLPEPACALMSGHEVAYYASLRKT